jgi:copper ion binding protein
VSRASVDEETLRFPVRGMTCSSCVSRIVRHLGRLDGVEKVSVDLRAETATVRRDAARVPEDAIARAIAEAGYEADLAAAVIVVPETPRGGILGRLLRR